MNVTCPPQARPARPAAGAAFLCILGALMAMTSLSTDIYLPAMPVMEQSLRGNAELTITGFLIGFAGAQLIWGPISDSFGRRLPLLCGMALFCLGSVGCALARSMEAMVFWRVFQALGAATGPMLARAMIRDLFAREKAAEMLSTLMIIMAVSPILGPFIGGVMIKFTVWQAIFWLLALAGLAIFIAVFFLPETLPRERRPAFSLGQSLRNYAFLLRRRSFMRYVLCVACYYVGIYAFVTGSAFVYIRYYGISPQYYGWFFAVNIVGVTGMSAVNRLLVRRFSLDTLLRFATLTAFIGALLTVLVVRLQLAGFAGGGAYSFAAAVFVFFCMNGIIAAGATAAALDKVPQIAGSASALIGCLQYGSGIVSSALLAWWDSGTPWAMTALIAVFSFLSFVAVRCGKTA